MIAVSRKWLQNALHMSMTQTMRASVAAIVIADGSGRLEATATAISEQVYELAGTVVVGDEAVAGALDPGVVTAVRANLADAIETVNDTAEYLWILTEGAVPLPDALKAAVADADRTEAGLVGSKIIGADDSLISVGIVTDAFGVSYSGLDSSEVDQGQYDVVRDVAAVSGRALLIRRDLLAGLGGIDSIMAPQAAAVDIAQRARLKGARIVVSPASEVRYDTDTRSDVRWREEASRIRAMLKVYSPLTLLWAVPLDFLLGLIEVVVSIFLGKWYGFDFVRAWGWNVFHLPSTIRWRHVARSGRVVGDEELFRYQRKGSVKLIGMSSASSKALRSRLPGDDRFNVEVIGDEIRQPAFVIGVLAVVFVLIASRNLWSDGFPAVGYTLPFPAVGGDALSAYAGGWNPAGLGSTEALRPLVAIAGFAKLVTFNAASFAEYILGAGALLAGIWGMMRLLRTWSISAAPGLIAGVVYVSGPAAQGIAGNTDLGTLLGLGVLPWALRLVLKPVPDGSAALFTRVSGTILTFGILGAFAPLLLLVPIPVVAIYALVRLTDRDAWRALILALIGTAGGALLLSPWIWSANLRAIATAGYAYWHIAPVVAVAGAVVIVSGVVAVRGNLSLIAGWAALIAGIGLLLSRSGDFGYGVETESVGLAAVSLGVAIAIGVVAQSVTSSEGAGWRRFVLGAGAVGVVLLVVASMTILLGGRIGLPGDRFTSAFEFTLATEGYAETSRLLVVGPPHLLPGDSRRIDGGSYRVTSAPAPDIGETWLSDPLELDEALAETLALVISGETKRVGGELARFGIRWIVVMGESQGPGAEEESIAWRDVFAGQLDLLPLTAAVDNTVFITDIHPVSRALTTSGNSWPRNGWKYQGDPEVGRRVFVAENPDDGWGPGPRVTTDSLNEISAETGSATFTPVSSARTQALVVLGALVLLTGVAVWGRKMR
jgi:GT2 family glycosyltransferase